MSVDGRPAISELVSIGAPCPQLVTAAVIRATAVQYFFMLSLSRWAAPVVNAGLPPCGRPPRDDATRCRVASSSGFRKRVRCSLVPACCTFRGAGNRRALGELWDLVG